MKASIITFHFVNNFGGMLQAFALQETVRNQCGTEAEIINYRNAFITITDFIRLFPVTKNPKEILSGLKTMSERFGRRKKFNEFLHRRMNLSSKAYNGVSLRNVPPEADVYICGSDQIWNPYLTFGIKGPYFLSFVREGKRRIAYAPSFGNASMPSVFRSKVKNYLEKFDALSVREKSGTSLIRELTGREAPQLIDPTFLPERIEWEAAAVPPKNTEPYLLLYIMQSDAHMYEYARTLKEKLGLRVVEISRYGYKPDFVDETLVDVGPEEFLGLFQHASYICTNSYHGFIFSLIFEKRFCLIPCKRFRTRIYNLAELLSMKIVETAPENAEDTVYDPETVRRVIGRERRAALAWLNSYIRGTAD